MKKLRYFSPAEWALWVGSVMLILGSYFLCRSESLLTLAASLIGATSLIFNAKGNPFGQLLMVIFSILYGVISYGFAYYGEMITYVGMTGPMALFALISWLRHPFQGNAAQVEVNRLSSKELIFMAILSVLVTTVFYFILAAFHTANMVLSTISVTTSFIAVYLTFRRSPLYAMGYASNDIVLIALWVLAAIENRSYISVVVCFVAFLVNDLYGFICWQKMYRKQRALREAS